VGEREGARGKEREAGSGRERASAREREAGRERERETDRQISSAASQTAPHLRLRPYRACGPDRTAAQTVPQLIPYRGPDRSAAQTVPCVLAGAAEDVRHVRGVPHLHTLSLKHTHTHSHKHTLTHSLTYTLTHSLTHTHTLAHTLTLTTMTQGRLKTYGTCEEYDMPHALRRLRVWSRGSAEVSVQIPAGFDGMAPIPVQIASWSDLG
jgi:hypothetical protein